MEFTGIKEICIYAKDLDAMRLFYSELLELPVINEAEGKHVFFRCGRSVLLCFNPDDSALKTSPPGHYASGKQHFAFEVPLHEYENARTFIERKGIVITDEVKWAGGIKSFYFEDPAGNVLEVIPEKGLWD